MTSRNRIGVAALMAAALSIGVASITPVAASGTIPNPRVVATMTIGDFCPKLANTIEFLKVHPSRLSDFLLAAATRLFDQYCT